MGAILTLLPALLVLLTIDLYCLFIKIFLNQKDIEVIIDKQSPRWSETLLKLLACYGGVDVKLYTPLTASLPKNAIVLANHQSYVDIVALFVLLKSHTLRFVGKDSLKFGFPGVTSVLKLGRHAFVKQKGDPMGAVQAVKKFSVRCHTLQKSMVIFPEGTRSRDGKLVSFKTGGLRTIAEDSPLPFIVVALDGGYLLDNFAALKPGNKSYYYAKVVAVLDPVHSKKEMAEMLEIAKSKIEAQHTLWRASL